MESPPHLPLSGVKVIELCLARAGPTCVRHLSDWGADVIKVEPPDEGEDVAGQRDGFDFQNLHRNKRAIKLNLKAPEGHAAFMRLVKSADILIENMRPTVKHKLKVAWEDVHPINPRLVYGSVSGFGQSGPYRARGGVDQIAQGMSGIMSITGKPGDGPMRVGSPIGDLVAGSLLAMGIVMALYDRDRTGVGQWVHTSLLESLIFMLDFQATRWLIKKEVPRQAGNEHPTGVPTNVYPSSDGHFNIASSSERMWLRLCDAIGKPEWKDKAEWKVQTGRSKDRKIINDAIAAVTRTQSTAYWIKVLDEAGIPCGPIYTVDEVFADPQVQHLGIATPVRHPRLGELDLVASALNFSAAPKSMRSPTPEGGQHSDQVMRELGYTVGEIAAMRKSGVLM